MAHRPVGNGKGGARNQIKTLVRGTAFGVWYEGAIP